MKKFIPVMGLLLIVTFLVGPMNVQGTMVQPARDTSVRAVSNPLKTISKPSKVSTGTSQKQVSWDVTNNSYTDNYNYTSSGWEFGPTPSYTLKYSNNTACRLARYC